MTNESEDQGDTGKLENDTESQDDEETIDEESEDASTDVEDDDEVEDEPKLKYARLTSHLGPVYRNGDATSAFLVAGDKMVCPLIQMDCLLTDSILRSSLELTMGIS